MKIGREQTMEGHLHSLLASLDLRDDLAPHCTQMWIGFGFISVQILCISVTKEPVVLLLLRLIVTFSVFIRSACPHEGHLILFKALHRSILSITVANYTDKPSCDTSWIVVWESCWIPAGAMRLPFHVSICLSRLLPRDVCHSMLPTMIVWNGVDTYIGRYIRSAWVEQITGRFRFWREI